MGVISVETKINPKLEIDELRFEAQFKNAIIYGGYGSYENEKCYRVEAWIGNERIACVRLSPQDNNFVAENMWTLDIYRQQGFMTEMMDLVEKTDGYIVPSGDNSPEAKIFWSKRLLNS